MSTEKRNGILRLLVEGNSVRSVCRLMGTNIPTVLRQLNWAGGHCRELMAEHFHDLTLRHVECDEMWTYVAKKQARLTIDEKATCHDRGDVYLWIGICQDSGLVPVHLLGKRSADNARRFMVQLRNCLTIPSAHTSDAHAFARGGYKPVVQISTDGFSGYREATDLAFGPHAKHGVIIKDFRNATMKYDPNEMVGATRTGVRGISQSEERTICTSHCERRNATCRLFTKRLNRLTYCFSKKLQNLEDAVALHFANHNFCWRARYPDDSGKRGRFRPPAAMLAGVTDRLWTFNDLMAGGPA